VIPQYLTQSREAIESQSQRHCQTTYLGAGIVLCRVLGRYLMRADAEDLDITPHLCLDGFWESWVTLALAQRLQPGMRCLDVGANHGYYTLLMADAVGQAGHVLALEPNPQLAALVRQNAELNGFGDRIQVLERAAADCSRAVDLVMAPGRAGNATICRAPGPGEALTPVQATTVDDAVAHWPGVDLIKIDAEGAEPAIWAGMAATIEANPQLTVFLELTPAAYADPEGFLRSIEACGFPLRYVDAEGTARPASRDELLTADGGHWRMLCLTKP
jgi:FkbM family methyltransferase